MMRGLLVVAAAFGLSAALASTNSGCSSSGPDCSCPDGAPLPSRLTPHRLSSVSREGGGTMPIDLTEAIMEIDGAKMFFRYTHEGVSHEVTYKINPNP